MSDPLSAPASAAIARIEQAFAGVRLEDGMSLRQAELADDMSYEIDERWKCARQLDVVDNWTKIPVRDLEDLFYLAHVDAKGFRFYIPALLLLFVRDYDPGSMHVIQVLSALNADEYSWGYHTNRYALLSVGQKTAIAEFLKGLPSFVDLDAKDAATVTEALRVYWGQFLQ